MPLPSASLMSRGARRGDVARIFSRTALSVVLWATVGSSAGAQAQSGSPPTTRPSTNPALAPPSTSGFLSVRGGDEDCPTQSSLEKRVLEIREREGSFASGTRFKVNFARVGLGWSAEVRALDGSGSTLGTRRIESKSPNCADTSEPVALVLALLLDAGFQQTDPPATSEALARPSPELVVGEVWHSELTSELGVGLGAMPKLSVGPRLGVWVHAPRQVSFYLRGLWFPEQTVQAEKGGVAIADASVAVGLCLRWEWELWHWPLCSFAEGERVRLWGFGFDQNLAVSELVPRVGASTGLRLAIASRVFVRGDYALSLGLETYRAISRDNGGNDRVVWVQDRWASFLSFGVGLELF